MADLPTGRALDEAVSKAMGTYAPECDGAQQDIGDGYWSCDGCQTISGPWSQDLEPHARVLRYSTDPATDPEKVAWLESRAYAICLLWDDRSKKWHASMRWNEGEHHASGASITEALARLVVAVEEAGR